MRLLRCCKSMLVTLACLGILLPVHSAAAAPSSASTAPTPTIHDVRLDAHGALRGQLIDKNGQPCANQSVALGQTSRPLAQTRTDAAGNFAFAPVRSGVYYLTDGRIALACRAWTNHAAPPAAQPRVLLVAGETQARGQQPLSALFTNPLIIGLIIAAAVAIPLAIHKSNQDKQSGS